MYLWQRLRGEAGRLKKFIKNLNAMTAASCDFIILTTIASRPEELDRVLNARSARTRHKLKRYETCSICCSLPSSAAASRLRNFCAAAGAAEDVHFLRSQAKDPRAG